jgi:uroporphyrinogen decarboxylase
VPLIYYVNQGAVLVPAVASLEVDVVGVDWRASLTRVRRVLGPDKAVQGNLDPAALFAPAGQLERHVDAVLEEAGNAPGHIFNLGHGILPETPVENVKALCDFIREHSAEFKNADLAMEHKR